MARKGSREPLSVVASLSNGVTEDQAAVSAAISRGGLTAKPKARSPSPSLSNVKCTAAPSSTYFRLG
jgi:hypothetical protein